MTYKTCNQADCAGCAVCASGPAHAVQDNDPPTKIVHQTDIPEGIKGWCWGAFLLSWIWAIGNRTWIGLLGAIPYIDMGLAMSLDTKDPEPAWMGLLGAASWVGIGVTIWLGFKGRELAWKNREWESVEHFNHVQRAWTIWGIVIHLLFLVGVIAVVGLLGLFAYWFFTTPGSFRVG